MVLRDNILFISKWEACWLLGKLNLNLSSLKQPVGELCLLQSGAKLYSYKVGRLTKYKVAGYTATDVVAMQRLLEL